MFFIFFFVSNLAGDFKVVISNANIQTLENGSLSIREVNEDNSGEYMCQAINGVRPGISVVIHLTVKGNEIC